MFTSESESVYVACDFHYCYECEELLKIAGSDVHCKNGIFR